VKTIRNILLLLFLVFAQGALCAESRAGQVVWWGRDIFWKNRPSNHTNGVIENGGEILSNVVAIAALHLHAFLLTRDGTVFTCGQTMHERGTVSTGLSNVVSIIEDGSSCWAIRRDGTVTGWGGDEDNDNIAAGLTNITAITWAGYRSYLALKTDGTVFGFRFDTPGVGESIDPITGLPTPVVERTSLRQLTVGGQILSNVVAMASMGDSSIVLKKDGTVVRLKFSLMDPASGLPMPLFQYLSADPVTVDGQALTNVVALASGGGHCLALTSNGTVVAWGNNHYGETGVPNDLGNVVAIAAAEHLSLALKRDGTVAAWGGNYFGQTSVPVGLSNVVAIAAGGWFSMAITTGAIPSSVYIRPHGRMEETAAASDLVFKGRVMSSSAITNASFPDWGNPFRTKLEVISVFKGDVETNKLVFLHLTKGPNAWGGGTPPSHYNFEFGQSYIVFAVKADKPDWLYSPSSNQLSNAQEFRQPMRGEFAIRAFDDRPLPGLTVKDACWLELNRLLTSATPTNSLYAIQQLHLLSKGCGPYDDWPHSEDFKREAVLKAVLPLVTNPNDQVAASAMGCFAVGGSHIDLFGDLAGPQGRWMPIVRGCSDVQPECLAKVSPYADALVAVANSRSATLRRVAAIAALSCTGFPMVSNSLPRWLADSTVDVRAQAVWLLPDFPGEYCEQALRERATDASPMVRAAVADAIGNGKIEGLLPTLGILFSTSPVRTNSGPWPHKDLQGDGYFAEVGSDDIHSSAGYAFQKFEVNQVGAFLKTNLNDPIFGTAFLRKLAENDPGPWLNDLVGVLKERRERVAKQVEASGVEPKTDYYRALMALSGTHFQCWNIIYEHLKGLGFSAFTKGNMDRCLDELENAGDTGSREPLMLYELYRMKGLNKRAEKFRKEIEPTFAAHHMTKLLDDVDARYSRNGTIPDQ